MVYNLDGFCGFEAIWILEDIGDRSGQAQDVWETAWDP